MKSTHMSCMSSVRLACGRVYVIRAFIICIHVFRNSFFLVFAVVAVLFAIVFIHVQFYYVCARVFDMVHKKPQKSASSRLENEMYVCTQTPHRAKARAYPTLFMLYVTEQQ